MDLDLSDKITKGAVRSRYPWKSLTEVGTSFTIPAENSAGVANSRQLCYAANKAQQRKESTIRFRAVKNGDRSVTITRII